MLMVINGSLVLINIVRWLYVISVTAEDSIEPFEGLVLNWVNI